MLDSFPQPAELKGALQGTVLYLALYLLVFVPFQVLAKWHVLKAKKREAKKEGSKEKVSYRAIKYYNSRDILALASDRTIGNFVEYAIAFLPMMWLHALFVDPTKSFTICALYVAFRCYYPFVYQKGMLLLTSTVPGYLVIAYLFFELAIAAFSS